MAIMTEQGNHRLDRRAGESDTEYDARIDQAAREQGVTRAEYEAQANAEAGRPAKTAPDSDSQETGTI
jgi:hypothetical protein